MFSISSFRNESGCFEQEKCPGVYLSSLRTKCTQDTLIFKVYFWRSKKLSDVVQRLTWSLTERERATCEDEWLNTSRTKVYSGHHLTEFGLSCEPPVTIRRSSRGELIKLRKSILCNNNHHIMLITFSDTVRVYTMRKYSQADNGSNYSSQNNWTSFLNRSAKYHLGTEPSVCGDCGSPVSRCLREFLWISYLVQSRLMKAHCTWYKSIIIHWTAIDNWDRVESIRVQDLNIIRRWPVDHLQKKVKDNKDL